MASNRHSIRARRGLITLYGADKAVADWASNQLYGVSRYFGDHAAAIGVILDEKMICAFVYNNYTMTPDGEPLNIEMSIASIDKRWASRHTLREAFAYPFIQLGLERVQATTSTQNEGANSMLTRLGFQKEGEHRKAYPNKDDAYSWSMLKSDCRWI